ncbi:glycerophosphodiester phosphodiesterase [Clostridium sp. BL-8]|uniref:glycerophosphodiester phosphodiesterase n=1 Tax=Clostridium sp. BL-8 TaxID=349938 RepID=UPI00098BE8DC|nr:glycerophosphodiester phosphodiesterase [Clostridium sp. BL-8]OOM79965.1 putative glycerophosphoryl diester phosphodiesterase 1 [Clostridium sp. BL-8]
MSRIKVWGHRGASGYAPENTLEAFQMAVEMKADGIELDVQLTKDGELVVIHDETIERVSNGTGWVKDYTLKELKGFNYNKMHPEYKFSEIPTLNEVYALLKNTNLYINVELKTGIIFYDSIEEKVLELANMMNIQDRIIYSSFNHYSVMKIKELSPEAKLGFLYTDGFIDMPRYCKKMRVNSIHPSFNNLKYHNFIESCKKNRLQINVWNVRDSDIKYCCENNINTIITNYPDRTKNIIYEYNKGE